MHALYRPACTAVLAFLLAAGTSAQTPVTTWQARCSPRAAVTAEGCGGGGPVGSSIERSLGGALEWMRGLGFRAPSVLTMDGHYVVYLSDAANMEGAAGDYSDASNRIRFDAEYLAEEGPVKVAEVATHELFHAVQHAYLVEGSGTTGAGWLREGTADAVAIAYTLRGSERPGTTGGPVRPGALGPPDPNRLMLYSDPLTSPRDRDQDYLRSHFWLALGDMLGSQDRVQYLHPLLEALRRGTYANEASSLHVLDDFLKGREPEGLAYYFPRIAARYTTHTNHFTSATNDRVTVAPSEATSYRKKLPPVAAHRYSIVRDDESGCDEPVSVEVSFDAQSRTLHHSFDGVPSDEIERARDGTYRTTLGDGDSLVVHVANVAEVASETAPESYTLGVSGAPSCECGDYLAVARALVTGPGGELELEERMVRSPVGVHQLTLPFEALRVTGHGRAFDYYPAVTVLGDAEDVAVMMFSPEEGDIEAMRSQPGVRVEGEITAAVPSGEVGIGEAFHEGAGRGFVGGSFSVNRSEPLGPKLEFTMNTLGFSDGTAILVGVDATTAGTYRWDGRTSPMSPTIRVRGGEVLLHLDSDVVLTLDEVVPGRCVSGTFSGGAYTDPGEPSAFTVAGSFFLRAPPGLGDAP